MSAKCTGSECLPFLQCIRWPNPSAFSDVAGICDSGKENYNDTSSQATDAGIQWDIAFDETGRRLEGRKYFGKKKRI